MPRRPKLVLERGYGDCKDKSLLLSVALRRLGIDAVPALVATQTGRNLLDRLPSPLMFDHVIVRVTLADRVLWIDPTATHRGGRGFNMVPADLGYGLPILAGQQALEKIEGYAARAGAMDVVERFSVDESAATPLKLRVETRFTDDLADWMRGQMAARGSAAIERNNLEFYQKRFAGLTATTSLAAKDERDANIFTMVEDYTLSKADFDKAKIVSDLEFNAYSLRNLMPDRQAGPRLQPLGLPAYAVRNHVIELKAKDRRLWGPADVEAMAGKASFSRRSVQDGDVLRITYKFAGGDQLSVPAAEAEAIYALSEKIADASGLAYHIDKVPRLADAAGMIDPQALAPYRDDLAKVSQLMQAQDQASHVQALTILNQLAGKAARPSTLAGFFDGMKGLVLAGLSRKAPAKAALLSSIDQYQGNADMIRLLIALQIDDGDVGAILKTLNVALKAQPTVIAQMNPDWLTYMSQRINALPPAERKGAREDYCIVLASAGWGLEPRTVDGDQLLDCAIRARLDRKQLADAQALLRRQPTAATLARFAVDKRYQAIWPDLALMVAEGFKERIDREVAEAAERARQVPDDFDAVRRHVRALRMAGKPEQAVAAGKKLAEQSDRIEATGEDAFWFVNEYAYALAEAGQVDKAIAQMDGIMALGVEQYPGLISQAINRASMLSHWGRSNEALIAFTEADEKYANYANLFGKMWIWSGKACALRELNRVAEAKVFEDKLAEKPQENPVAVTIAAACRGDQAAVEAQLLARLDDPERRDGVLAGLINFTATDRSPPFDRKLRQVVDAARANPVVQEKFNEFGRPISFAGSRTYWGDF